MHAAQPEGTDEAVSAQTYQPLRFLKEDWNGAGTALIYDFGFLPPTPARLAMLTPTVPAGYQQVPAPGLGR